MKDEIKETCLSYFKEINPNSLNYIFMSFQDLDIDEIDLIALIIILEEKYLLVINDEEFLKNKNIEDLIFYLLK